MKKKETKKSQEFLFDAKQIPTNSGCYLFKDKDGSIIYVGKAKNLRSRVSSYFQKTKKSPKTESLVKKIKDIETRTVNSEMEALILENNLIKEHKPKYNILLRDDKNFLYLRITKEVLPKMEITRRLIRDGSTYIGPRTSAKSFRNTIAFCQKFFGVKMVNPAHDNYISRMKGAHISDEEYKLNIKRMIKFLRGNTKEILKELAKKMMTQAGEKNFEGAGKTRDLIQSIGGSTQRQTVELPDDTPRDFISFVRDDKNTYFVRLLFRDGKFINQNEVLLRAETFHEDAEILRNFLIQFYPHVDELPSEIILPIEIEDSEEICELLQEKHKESKKLEIKHAQKGDKVKILDIAKKNAENMAEKHRIQAMSQAQTFLEALPDLTNRLGLTEAPERIECFDISHFAGQETVASQVVFMNGEKKTPEYRRYKMKTLEVGEIDDFKSMKEVLTRRFSGLQKKNPEILEIHQITKKTEKKKLFEMADTIFINELNFPSDHSDEKYYDDNQYIVFGIFDGKNPIGVISAKIFSKTFWQISGLAVQKEVRKKGLGKMLIEELGKYAQSNNVKKFFVLPDATSQEFYEKVDFIKNEEPIKKIRKYVDDMKEKYSETNTVFESFEYKIPKPIKETKKIPDLIVIDGGKGQLSSVLEVFEKNPGICPAEFDPQTQIIALAKREEEVFQGSDFKFLDIPINSPASKLLQRIRDEAHRFAITYNKNLRSKALTKSILDDISGIGGSTKKKLLHSFGSVAGIREANDEQLLEIVNKKQLENLRKNI